MLLAALVVSAAAGLFFYCDSFPSAMAGAIPTALAAVYILGLLRSNLRLNSPARHLELKAGLGPANWITLARGGLIAVLAGCVLQPWAHRYGDSGCAGWLPGVVYLTAVAGDALDGYVARATARQTRLGALLDTRIDALGILVACLVAIGQGRLPFYYLSAGLAYYLLGLAVRVRKKTGRPCADVRPRRGAKVMAGIQMVFLGVALLPLFPPQLIHIAAVVVLIPFLLGFFLDWQAVRGHA